MKNIQPLYTHAVLKKKRALNNELRRPQSSEDLTAQPDLTQVQSFTLIRQKYPCGVFRSLHGILIFRQHILLQVIPPGVITVLMMCPLCCEDEKQSIYVM